MTLIKVSKQISELDHFKELGFVYLWFDWKESDELIRMIEGITKSNPKTVRIINMRDDSYHVVFANVPFTIKEARRFITLEMKEPL